MTPALAIAAAGVALAFLLPSPVPAHQFPCRDRAEVMRELSDTAHVSRAWYGVEQGGELTELFVNAKTGTWTVLITPPGGAVVCQAMFGTGSAVLPARASRGKRS